MHSIWLCGKPEVVGVDAMSGKRYGLLPRGEPEDRNGGPQQCSREGCNYAVTGIIEKFCCQKCSLQPEGGLPAHGVKCERRSCGTPTVSLVPRAERSMESLFGPPSGNAVVLISKEDAIRKASLRTKLDEVKWRKQHFQGRQPGSLYWIPKHTAETRAVAKSEAGLRRKYNPAYIPPEDRSEPDVDLILDSEEEDALQKESEMEHKANSDRDAEMDELSEHSATRSVGAISPRLFRDFSLSGSRSPLRRRRMRTKGRMSGR